MSVIRFLVFPLSIIFKFVTDIRNKLYDCNFLKSEKINVPVISVGNLSTGGTGKTPMVDFIIYNLKRDYNISVLSRGYNRKSKGFIEIKNSDNPSLVGDEPFLIKSNHSEVPVFACEDRVEGAKKIISENNTNLILLDDAFQHRKISRNLDIVLTDYNNLFYKDYLLPYGNLRESRNNINRADVIIVTKCPLDFNKADAIKIKNQINPKKTQSLFFSQIKYSEKLFGFKELSFKSIRNSKLTLVTGIANSQPLKEYLKKNNVNFDHFDYPDHYNYSRKDVNKILATTKNNIILTTKKDYYKLSQFKIDNLLYIDIKVEFLDGKQEFLSTIKEVLI
jgi:tetraacyldisaccharide 4'-kinase